MKSDGARRRKIGPRRLISKDNLRGRTDGKTRVTSFEKGEIYPNSAVFIPQELGSTGGNANIAKTRSATKRVSASSADRGRSCQLKTNINLSGLEAG